MSCWIIKRLAIMGLGIMNLYEECSTGAAENLFYDISICHLQRVIDLLFVECSHITSQIIGLVQTKTMSRLTSSLKHPPKAHYQHTQTQQLFRPPRSPSPSS